MKLHALGGGAAPAQIAADLKAVTRLPSRAKERFWEALGPSLREPLTGEVEETLTRFCQAFEVDDAELGRAVRASRFLLREAGLRDLDRALFAEDLRLVSGGSEEVSAILLAGYEAARMVVRREILEASLADHGKLVESLEWRVDTMGASSRGDQIKVPVVWLTIGYREGDQRGRISLQLTPEVLRSLKLICDRLVSS